MASEVPQRRLDNGFNPQLLFQGDNPLRRGFGDPDPKTRQLGGFMDDKLFGSDHRDRYFSPEVYGDGVYGDGSASDERAPLEGRNWSGTGPTSTPSSGEEEEEDKDDGDGDDDDEVEGLVGIDSGGGGGGGKNNHTSSGGGGSAIGGKIGVGNSKNHASFGSSTMPMIMKDGSLLQPGANANMVSLNENDQQGSVRHFQKMMTIAQPGDMCYSQLLQGTEGSNRGYNDVARDNGCGFSGRKDGSVSSDHGESLRAIFTDPITGALMDDAMILPCGHTFGHGGIQQVIKMTTMKGSNWNS